MPQDTERLRLLVDRVELQDLVDRYLTGLDDAEFDDDWARSVFTEDGRFEFALGGHEGVAGMAAFTAAMMGKWQRTHHVSAGHHVDLDGDLAQVRGTLIATHLHRDAVAAEPFQVGDRFEGEAVRTAGGWRFTRLAFEVVWSRGTPPGRVDINHNRGL